ncbi:MAG: hypothetical protein V4541_02240 [Bacteroidota bacterium]
MKKNLVSNSIKAMFMVGTLDILAAFIQYFIKTQKNPIAVLKFIASGVFGSDAFTGGNKMALFGLVFHYFIALLFTLIFFWLYPQIKLLIKNKIVMGVIYGSFIWIIMQFVVLPLSNAPALKITFQGAIIAVLTLILCIGIPLSFLAARNQQKQ